MNSERRYWLAGHCPCCGSEDFDNDPDAGPEWIGEGVRLCAHCVYRGHHEPDIATVLLQLVLA